MDWTGFARLESLGIAAVSAAAYFTVADGSLLLLVATVLIPDVGMIGYLRGPRTGAVTYNSLHTYVGPALLLGFGLFSGPLLAHHLGLIWAIHIAVDRTLGFGLKTDGFHHTHLGSI